MFHFFQILILKDNNFPGEMGIPHALCCGRKLCYTLQCRVYILVLTCVGRWLWVIHKSAGACKGHPTMKEFIPDCM